MAHEYSSQYPGPAHESAHRLDGRQRSILQVILARFPLLFERFIEVFGGSGVVMFGKEKSTFEVWNDCNGDLYNFYYCVKYCHLALLQALDFLPFTSRREFELMNSFLAGKHIPMADEIAVARATLSPKDALQYVKQLRYRCKLGDVSRAAAFFKLNHMSYGSGMGSFNAQPCDLRRFYWKFHTAHSGHQSGTDRGAGTGCPSMKIDVRISATRKIYYDPTPRATATVTLAL